MKARYQKYVLNFKTPGGTSRGVLKTKETWFVFLEDRGKLGIGETGMFKGLSYDDVPDYEEKLAWACENIHLGLENLLNELKDFPSIQFGLEQAFTSFENESPFEFYPSKFSRGEDQIPINGLIWMGTKEFMQKQIEEKLAQGFDCIKMKIGAVDFETELELLKSIRKEFSSKEIELRVDANGAFHPNDALEKLKRLSEFDLHSIEQPIKQGQYEDMAALCAATPLPIALDEELIGITSSKEKEDMLALIQPQYIILKPSLIGGFAGSEEWINLASANDCGWWITSALESNIGLNVQSSFF